MTPTMAYQGEYDNLIDRREASDANKTDYSESESRGASWAKWAVLAVIASAALVVSSIALSEVRKANAMKYVIVAENQDVVAIGNKILKNGGTAADAALAVVYALGVVAPQSVGLGGGSFITYYEASTGKTIAYDGRETASATSTSALGSVFTSRWPVLFSLGAAVGVPGTPRVFEKLHQEHGSMPMAELLLPAETLADNGFVVDAQLAANIIRPGSPELGRQPWADRQEARELYFKNGNVNTPYLEGDTLVNKDLAKTIRLIRQYGVDVMYHSSVVSGVDIPSAIIAATKDTAVLHTLPPPADCKYGFSVGSATNAPGELTVQDFATYQAIVREPVTVAFKGFTIKGTGPPSSGMLTVGMALYYLEKLGIASMSFGSERYLNAVTQSIRLAFADRGMWMGDEDFLPYNQHELLNSAYLDTQFQQIDMSFVKYRFNAGSPPGFAESFTACPVGSASSNAISEEQAGWIDTGVSGSATTSFSVIDSHGNVASVMTTIESDGGTGIVVPGFGFVLNNELTDFNWGPASCNAATGNPGANDAGARRRPRSSMIAAILFDGHGQPVATMNSVGGPAIIHNVIETVLKIVVYGQTPQAAVDGPRIKPVLGGPVARIQITQDHGLLYSEINAFNASALAEGIDVYKKCGPLTGRTYQTIAYRKYLDSTRDISGTTDCRRCTNGYASGSEGIVTCASTAGERGNC